MSPFSNPNLLHVLFQASKLSYKRIDKIQRAFLWGRTNGSGSNKGMPLVGWNVVITPKKMGGMGITNIELQNEALLLRWWWRLYEGDDSLWAIVCRKLYAKPSKDEGPVAWIKKGSFFWTALATIKHIFHWCTSWVIGNGHRINFR